MDTLEEVDFNWKFDVIICASFLEFVNIGLAMFTIDKVLSPKGILIVASPMDNLATRLYFKMVGSDVGRNTRYDITDAISRRFKIVKEKTWLNLYFAVKAKKR